MLFSYWMENVVVGLINIVKMVMARGLDPDSHRRGGACFSIPFFIFHYGLFTLVHGSFIVSFFSDRGGGGDMDVFFATVRELLPTVWPVFVSLSISHGISFWKHFVKEKEYEKISVREQMFVPYGRVILMHFIVLLGGFIAHKLGGPKPVLLALLLVKVYVDVRSHVKEHSEKTERLED